MIGLSKERTMAKAYRYHTHICMCMCKQRFLVACLERERDQRYDTRYFDDVSFLVIHSNCKEKSRAISIRIWRGMFIRGLCFHKFVSRSNLSKFIVRIETCELLWIFVKYIYNISRKWMYTILWRFSDDLPEYFLHV